jgi:small-conductance mechanosensitive channel
MVIVIVVAITYWLTRILGSLARSVESEAVRIPGFSAEWARPTNRLVSLVLTIFAVVVSFPYLPGGDSPAFRGISIFIGVLVSLGSSSAMGNLVAGVILTYMRPFRVGDRVKIAETVGDVTERSFLVTRLRTIKNVLIVVPNSMILNAHIHNYSAAEREEGLVLHTSITIGYSTPWRTVHDLLIDAALGSEDVLREPRPFVLQISLNDFHITYQVNAFTRAANRMEKITAEIHQRIQDEFNKAGVEIMSPTYLSLRDGNASAIPDANLPAGYAAPAFRVQMDADGGKAGQAPHVDGVQDVVNGLSKAEN